MVGPREFNNCAGHARKTSHVVRELEHRATWWYQSDLPGWEEEMKTEFSYIM